MKLRNNYNNRARKVKAEYFVTGFLFCLLFITLLRSQILKEGSGFLASLSPDRGRPVCSWQGGFFNKAPSLPTGGSVITGTGRPSLCERHILGLADRPAACAAGRPALLTNYSREGGGPPPADTTRPPHGWLDELIDKIHMVESGGQLDPAAGDNGMAVGALQIHRCAVDDVNRHYKTNFSYTDRGDFTKARLIARLYIQIWIEKHREEIAARIFNGGPRGWQKKSTDAYWEKIQRVE